jgi:hypothetical protein
MLPRFHLSLVVISSLLIAFTSKAQDNFVPGAVINFNGDTIKGSVNDQRWDQTPVAIQFKNSSGETISYSPKNIQGFVVTGKSLFWSKIVSYDSTSNNPQNLPESRQPQFKNEQVFLQVIVSGKTSLLKFKEKSRMHFFMMTENFIEELVNHRYYMLRNGSGVILSNQIFVEQLKKAFADCSVTIKPSYRESDLMKLFVQYNACKNSPTKTFNAKEPMILKSGLVAFGAFDQFNPDYKGTFGYGFGGFVTLKFPNKNYKSAIVSEVAYRKTGNQESNEILAIRDFYQIQSIQWTNLFTARVFRKNEKFRVAGGFSFSGGLADKYWIGSGKVLGQQANIFTTIIAGVSYELIPHLVLDLRYESGDSILIDDYVFGNSLKRSSALRAGLGFTF